MQTALLAWLAQQPNLSNIRPFTVRIAGQQWEGAAYTSTGHYEANMMGVTNGDHKAGEAYTEERFYLLGPRPKVKRPHATCFIGPDGQVFYVSCYMDADAFAKCDPEVKARYHPFGPSFMLGVWPTEKHGAIDAYEHKPYDCIPLSMSE